MMDFEVEDGLGGISVIKSFRAVDEKQTVENMEDETTDHCLLVMTGVPVSMANAIRRVVLCDIPVLAIDEKHIKIKTNTGPLHCEYVSHRLSLIPVSMQSLQEYEEKGAAAPQEEDYGIFSQEGQDYGPGLDADADADAASGPAAAAAAEETYGVRRSIQERFKFTFSVKNDSPATAVMEVTTDNIRVFDIDIKKDVTDKMLPVIFKDKYLITKLKTKEVIECEFKLSMGTPTQHARWQAVNTISYRYLVGADNVQIQTPETMTYDKLSLSEEQAEDPKGFMFYIEKGVLPITTVCQQALQIIKDKVLAFSKFVNTNLKASWWRAKDQMLEFEYPKETHTVGNLIATYGLLQFPDAFIGYRITHPLENKILLRFKFAEGPDERQYFEKIQQICGKIIEDCENLSAHF